MVDTFLSIIFAYGVWIFFGLFVLAIACWEVWQFRIRPMLIPKSKIEAMTDALIARYGPDAEEMTYAERIARGAIRKRSSKASCAAFVVSYGDGTRQGNGNRTCN